MKLQKKGWLGWVLMFEGFILVYPVKYQVSIDLLSEFQSLTWLLENIGPLCMISPDPCWLGVLSQSWTPLPLSACKWCEGVMYERDMAYWFTPFLFSLFFVNDFN